VLNWIWQRLMTELSGPTFNASCSRWDSVDTGLI
jgi:hypothetical protein